LILDNFRTGQFILQLVETFLDLLNFGKHKQMAFGPFHNERASIQGNSDHVVGRSAGRQFLSDHAQS
jgi:hypothetical protein